MNRIILKGRLTADPELRQTTSNISVCRFGIAVDKYTKDGQKAVDFIRCIAWRNNAELVSKYFSKGKEILLEGALHNADYTDQNNVKHYGFEVQVEHVEFCGSKAENQTGWTQSAPAAAPSQIPNTNSYADYEEILADGEVPF